MWNFHGSLSLALETLRDLANTILWKIQGLSFVLSGIYRDKVKKWKVQGSFHKSISSMRIYFWQHELARYYKRGKLVSYFLNNDAKTCLYGLKISENIEIRHFFQSITFFHVSSNLHTSCLNGFNGGQEKKKRAICQGRYYYFDEITVRNICMNYIWWKKNLLLKFFFKFAATS